MGQFKPMVKMETTEPSVVLKLKKGGHVNKKESAKAEHGYKPMHKLDGGAMGDMGAMNAPAMIRPPVVGGPSIGSPRRPSMADRQKAMAMAKMMKSRRPPAAAPMGGLPTMKKGGKAGGEVETPAMHKMEMKGIKGIGKELKAHEGKPASKAHAGLKKGGMATGGVRLGNAGGFKTGGVVLGAGGYKDGGMATGGVKMGNAGGYKKGGAAKKFADGGRVDSGRAVSMPQGHKKPTPSVATKLVAGTFKKGGKVAHKEEGGYMDETKAYERWKANEKAENLADRDAMSNLPSKVMDFGSRVVNKIGEKLKGLGKGAVSNTEREITKTVIPAKKRGGMC
jgi:hypothetical protein